MAVTVARVHTHTRTHTHFNLINEEKGVNMKKQNAITLVSLIITVVIMLIIASVSIGAIRDSKIIEYAINAKSSYQILQDTEKRMLEYYNASLSGTADKWTQEGITLTKLNSDGTETKLKIGDYISYDAGDYTHTPIVENGAGIARGSNSSSTEIVLETGKIKTENLIWRVFGVNSKGELELISAEPTTQTLYLANDEGYLNAVDNLNTFCDDLYGNGKYSTGARSLNAEDLNKLTNFDPKTYDGYGNKWTYKYPTDEEANNPPVSGLTKGMWYKVEKADGTLITDWTNVVDDTQYGISYQDFRLPNETKAISSNNPGTQEVINTYYKYLIDDNLKTKGEFSLEEANEICNMILCGENKGKYIEQWLSSTWTSPRTNYMDFEINYITSYGFLSGSFVYSSHSDYQGGTNKRVRPIVSISSKTIISGTGENLGILENMWNIT